MKIYSKLTHAFFVLAASILVFTNCAGGDKKSALPKCVILEDAAYTEDNLIQVTVSAPASYAATRTVRRKTTSQENALLCAQREIVKFKTGKDNFRVKIQGGDILDREFDSAQNCTMTYRIEPGLIR